MKTRLSAPSDQWRKQDGPSVRAVRTDEATRTDAIGPDRLKFDRTVKPRTGPGPDRTVGPSTNLYLLQAGLTSKSGKTTRR